MEEEPCNERQREGEKEMSARGVKGKGEYKKNVNGVRVALGEG